MIQYAQYVHFMKLTLSFSTANRHVLVGFSVTVLTSVQLQVPEPDVALPLEVVNSKNSFLFLTLSI